ncbi:Golgi apparatus membrane protein TVP38 [Cylindrobasidium torrendii FP15055 ss-10]|uniref:Golgi apparatus membrane protein TVP38 n=1 Tax=Cylindrobasidium torrendii FP15055 ss-10 TaxID=1314674 RepID=A0A0D7BSX6_9AGAR|nr:Golgi apparatus membrane protein TVP38 [Cylindrobasidium torrendii FP15055 ss-10]
MTPKQDQGILAKTWNLVKIVLKTGIGRYRKLHFYGKAFIWFLGFFYICFGAFIIVVTPARIAQFTYDQATKLSHLRFGWLVLAGIITLVSFPPLIGHTTIVTLCGFAYGMKGFPIAAVSSVFGSALVFVLLRLCFSHRIRQWSIDNKKWQALESVVQAKGLPLIILTRMSPFPPWVYSNTLFSSIEAVSLWQFMVATCFVFPKILLHVWLGTRMAALSDGETRGHMDTQTKILNGCLVGAGILVAIFSSWLVYTLVQKHIRELEGIPADIDELAAEAIEDFDENAPLLHRSFDEEER